MRPFDEDRIRDLQILSSLDRADLLGGLSGAADQVRRGLRIGQDADLAATHRDEPVRFVLVGAGGGARLAGDALARLAGDISPRVVDRVEMPGLPGWFGSEDLLGVVTHRGASPYQAELVREAGKRGARVLTVGDPTSEPAAACAEAGGVHLTVPALHFSARASVWGLLAPTAIALARIGGPEVTAADLEDVATRLEAVWSVCAPGVALEANPAKQLAGRLEGSAPVIVGGSPTMQVVADRLRQMLARTARIPSMTATLPDAAQDVLACLAGPLSMPMPTLTDDPFAATFAEDGDRQHGRLGLVILRDDPGIDSEAARDRSRLADQLADEAEQRGVEVITVRAEAGHPLVRIAGVVHTLDLAAAYLALAHAMDPLAPELIVDLARR